MQLLLQQLHMVHVLTQPSACLGGLAGLATQHQGAAHAFFQQADALRDGRGRDVQGLGGALEAAFAHHGGQCREGGIVQHEFSFSNVNKEKTVCLHFEGRANSVA